MATGGISLSDTEDPPEPEESVHNLRGHAVFIVNKEEMHNTGGFQFKERDGAEIDFDNLNAVFIHKLGFSLINPKEHSHMNLTREKWNELRCQFQEIDHSNSDYFLIAISSHGKELKGRLAVMLSDGNPLYVSEIMEAISYEKLPTLKGKTRILILQICRTNDDNPESRVDRGATIQVGTESKNPPGRDQQRNTNDQSSRFTEPPGPEESEFDICVGEPGREVLIVYAVTSGKLSMRNTQTGSWMLSALKQITDGHDMGKPMDFMNILTEVAGCVAQLETKVFKRDKEGEIVVDDNGKKVLDEEMSGMKNAVCISHKLTQSVIFYPQEHKKKPVPAPPDFAGMKKKKNKK